MEKEKFLAELIRQIGFGGITLISAYCYYYIAKCFLQVRKRVWLVGLSYAVMMFFLFYIPVPVFSNFTAHMIGVLTGFVVLCLLEPKNPEQKIFLAVTFFSLRWLSLAMEASLNVVLNEMGLRIIEGKSRDYKRDTGKNFYDTYVVYRGLCFFYYFISFAAILVFIILFQNFKEKQKEEKRSDLLAAQVEETKKHITQVERLYGDIRGLKHDMGNHIMILENLCARKEYEEAGDYLARLKEETEHIVTEIRSGNPVTDVILTEKKREAEEEGIAFICEFYYPEGSRVNAFDLSVILNNALKNAIEAARECDHPYIRILSYRKKMPI